MPVVGTKRIEIDGQQTFLPAEEVELEKLISAGLAAQERKALADAELKAVKAQLVEIAKRRLFGRKSVTLTAPTAGAAQVTFGTEPVMNTERVIQLEQELAPSVFQKLFAKVVSYSPVRGLKQFLDQPQSREQDKLKAAILAAVDWRSKTPSVKLLGEARAGDPTELDDAGE